MAKGTSKQWAIVCANKVLPDPVEPNIMMFDFSSLKKEEKTYDATVLIQFLHWNYKIQVYSCYVLSNSWENK
jgi:hypothetical protein